MIFQHRGSFTVSQLSLLLGLADMLPISCTATAITAMVMTTIRKETTMVPISSLHDILTSSLYTEGKFWVAAGGLIWALSQASTRVMHWFKDVKDVVLVNLQGSIDKLGVDAKEHTATIVGGFREQTGAMVSELREQRADLRML